MTLDLLAGYGQVMAQMPLDELREALGRHQATAPILDPTSYAAGGGDRLRAQAELVDAAIAYRDRVAALLEQAR